MSSIYNTEPQPTASIILHTTQGELSVELFAKQTPLTSRNFLQLCLDGYYDNTIFHRLVPGFILQGGDPTGTGDGGESIYDGGALGGDLDAWPMDQRRGRNAGSTGANFKDEFHSRLKFNRRGQLGMANEGTPDSNGSQFFFTLGNTEELNGKNTIFGRVVGDTIYNLAKMGEAEVEDEGERPLYPIKLVRVEILANPFEDMQRRERVARRTETAAVTEKKPKKRKGGKQLLSFGDEEGDGEALPVLKKAKFDARIIMDGGDEEEPSKKAPGRLPSKKEKKSLTKHLETRQSPQEEARLNASSAPAKPPHSGPKRERIQPKYEDGTSPEAEISGKRSLLEQTNEEIAAIKASMRRNVHAEPTKEKKKSALEQLIPETATRGRKRRSGGNSSSTSDEQKTLKMLQAFQSRLEGATDSKGPASPPPTAGKSEEKPTGEGADDVEGEVCDLHFIANCQSCQAWDKLAAEEDSDDEGWMSRSLSFAADKLGKDLSYRKKAEEELVVIDPREKSRNLQEGRRTGREARPGGSGRAWDQARNAQMARASALSGRGAR